MREKAGKKWQKGSCEEERIVRKVAGSGHISYKGHVYFVTKALAGNFLQVMVTPNQIIIDTAIPFHKEFPLKKEAKRVPPRD